MLFQNTGSLNKGFLFKVSNCSFNFVLEAHERISGFERPIQVYHKRVSSSFARTGSCDHSGIPKACITDSFSPPAVASASEDVAKSPAATSPYAGKESIVIFHVAASFLCQIFGSSNNIFRKFITEV